MFGALWLDGNWRTVPAVVFRESTINCRCFTNHARIRDGAKAKKEDLEVELQKINQALDSCMQPHTFPVAIRMVSSAGEVLEKDDTKASFGKAHGSVPVCSFGTALSLSQDILSFLWLSNLCVPR